MNQRRTAVLMLLVAGTACDPGKLENPDRFKACLINIEQDVFVPKCGSAGCHAAMNPSNGLDLVSTGVAMRIKTGNSTTCQNKPLVSYMSEKLTESPSCGSPMPLGDPLPAIELRCVREYLTSIASDGGT